MEVTIRRLNAALLPAFLPYLLPEAAEAIETGRDDIIALGAVTNANQTCGAVVGELYDERLTVFSLYVDPEVRRQGVGALLLDSLLQLYPEAKPMAAWVLPEESFTEMDAFFQARGFAAAQNEGFVYCLNTEDLRHVPVVRWAFSPTFRPDRNIVPLDELTQEEREDLLCDASIAPSLRLGELIDRLSPELSVCYRYKGRIAAYFICGKTGAREMAVLAAVSRSWAHPAAMLQMITATIHRGLDYFGGDFLCWIEAINGEAEELVRAISGGTYSRWLIGETQQKD